MSDQPDLRKNGCLANFSADDRVDQMLSDHFAKYAITPLEVGKNFSIYARRIFLKRFLVHYELYRKIMNLPGDIVELGVFRGASLMNWANFLEIRNMGDRQKQVFGFDNFAGLRRLTEEDGGPEGCKQEGGFNSGCFEEMLEEAIDIFDNDRFIPYKPRIKLIKGEIEETVPNFVRETPGLRIALLHFDCDLYAPTKIALEHLYPLVVKGGVIAFDEYGIRPWEGESRAVDEFFADRDAKIVKFDWAPNPGGYILKQ